MSLPLQGEVFNLGSFRTWDNALKEHQMKAWGRVTGSGTPPQIRRMIQHQSSEGVPHRQAFRDDEELNTEFR